MRIKRNFNKRNFAFGTGSGIVNEVGVVCESNEEKETLLDIITPCIIDHCSIECKQVGARGHKDAEVIFNKFYKEYHVEIIDTNDQSFEVILPELKKVRMAIFANNDRGFNIVNMDWANNQIYLYLQNPLSLSDIEAAFGEDILSTAKEENRIQFN